MADQSSKLPLIIFTITFLIGILSIIISFQSGKLFPEIFQQLPYPSDHCTPSDDCSGCGSTNDWYNCSCDRGDNDPWCCDGDGDHSPQPSPSHSPSPSRSPSPSPSQSPSPSPSSGSFSCTQLGPTPQSPQPGQVLTFTCKSTANNMTINHYNFRVNDGSPTKVSAPAGNPLEASFSYTVPASGNQFKVQCQVCTSTDDSRCTSWGQTN